MKLLLDLLGPDPVFSVLGAVGVIYAIWLIPRILNGVFNKPRTKTFNGSLEGKIHVIMWTLAPPIILFVQYLLRLHSKASAPDPIAFQADLDNLRHIQQLAGSVWAATLACILFLMPKPE